jgi:tRNA nucleotidyltransferase/poly(A) polymerase
MRLDLSSLPIDRHGLPAGHDAHMVGGSARDLLLGQTPADYDIAVAGNPEVYARKIADRTGGHLVYLGRPGKCLYRVVAAEQIFDITGFRGADIEADLRARDFTINAMGVDLCTGELIDPLDGRGDIAGGRVHITSEEAFRDDPVRLLRAHRMAATLGFRISTETRGIIQRDAGLIRTSAGERVREEFFKILATPASHDHLLEMRDSGLLFAVFPELSPLADCQQNRHHRHDVLTHTLAAFAHLEALITPDGVKPGQGFAEPGFQQEPSKHPLLKLAILLHDIAKPTCRSGAPDSHARFHGHEAAGASAAALTCERLRCSAAQRTFVTGIIRHHMRPLHLYQLYLRRKLTQRALIRLFMTCREDTPYLLLHARADMLGKGTADQSQIASFSEFLKHLHHRFLTEFTPRSASPPLLTGADLIAEFGLSPSPLFQKILGMVEETRLSRSLMERSEAIELVRRFLEANPPPDTGSTSNTLTHP